jgi:hypothetical protein
VVEILVNDDMGYVEDLRLTPFIYHGTLTWDMRPVGILNDIR